MSNLLSSGARSSAGYVAAQAHKQPEQRVPIVRRLYLRNWRLKRAFDLGITSVLGVTVLSWLCPLIALLIWLETRENVFFVQTRTGHLNKPFQCLKFRSMRSGISVPNQVDPDHHSITLTGRFLRKTGLDELPQFYNVLRGDMSIIGPRPHMLDHTKEFSEMVENYADRHKVKPGITGLAQVKGWKGPTPTAESIVARVTWDLHYINNWSVMLDLKIFWKTAAQIVGSVLSLPQASPELPDGVD